MNFDKNTLYIIIKTVTDYSVSLFFVILLFPLILVLALLIKFSGKGPIIFTQDRIGKNGKPFRIYKFRSMQNSSREGQTLINGKNDKRITSLGRFMRNHKLDEIPNFMNVLKGDLSIVGPRPEQQFYIEQIMLRRPDYKLIQSIKPGITSWGQVKYGYAENVDQMIERLDFDLVYLRNRSLWFDLKIVVYTIGIVLSGEGV